MESSHATLEAKRKHSNAFQTLGGNESQPRIPHLDMLLIESEDKIENFLDIQVAKLGYLQLSFSESY